MARAHVIAPARFVATEQRLSEIQTCDCQTQLASGILFDVGDSMPK